MTSLGPDSRAIIDAALTGDGLDSDRHDRLKRQLMTRIAMGAAAGAAVTATTKVATAGSQSLLSLFLTSAIKSGAVTGIVLAAGAGVHTLATSSSDEGAPLSARSAPTLIEQAPATPRETAAPAAVVPSASSAPEASAPTERPSASSIASEMDLLQEAQRALAAGDSARALSLLEQHERTYAGGSFREEREASRIVALCKVGRAGDARAAAARFLATYPRSPHRSRVQGACSTP